MSSRRLPGKVLVSIQGQPMLGLLLDRLKCCAGSPPVVVATSMMPEDDAIAKYCDERGVACFRGHLNDVASRFLEAATVHSFGAFVRVNGDSPLLDPGLVEQGIDLLAAHPCDLVTNLFPRSFPPGQSVEVVTVSAFKRACRQMSEPEDIEHVTRFFYRHAEGFTIHNFRSSADYAGIHLAVDTQDHLDTVRAIVARMRRPHWEYHLEEVVTLYREVDRTTLRRAS